MRTDRDIAELRACRRGDDRAARSFYARHAPALLACARAVLRDEALAHDAVQGAFCRVFSIPARRVDAVEDPRAWMATLVRREALTALRSRRRAATRERSMARVAAPGAARTPDAGAGGDLDRALHALPRRLREVLVLRHVAGLTFDQVALALGVPRGTVSTRHRRALEALRRALGDSSNECIVLMSKEQA